MSNRTIIRYFSAIHEFDPSTIDGDAMHIDTELSSDTHVTIAWGTGYSYTIVGRGIELNNGLIDGGKLTSVTLTNGDGETLSEIHLPSLRASRLHAESLSEFFKNIAHFTLQNNLTIYGSQSSDNSQDYQLLGGVHADKIHGLGGDDFIGGFNGNDTLIGGKGHDVFFFRDGWDHDTIVDFDMTGGAGHQDLLAADFDSIDQITQHGSSTVIDFGNGDTLTLLHTNKHQISESDFYSS